MKTRASRRLSSQPRLPKITIDVVRLGRGRRTPVRPIKATARRILEILNRQPAELSIALVDDDQIQQLNAEYRAKNEPTDVLSFPSDQVLPDGSHLIGDVVISVERATDQAKARRRSLEQELESLLIHGILHNLGYDHERSPKDARAMRAMERKVAQSLDTKFV